MKKWKVIVGILAVILAIGAGTIYYSLNVKEYETKDSKVDEIAESDFTIDLPEEAPEDDPAQPQEQPPSEEPKESAAGSIEEDAGANNDNETAADKAEYNKPKTAPKPAAATIVAKYKPSFQSLESQATAKLDSLLAYAITEYGTKKANGEDVSYFYFYQKYNAAAKRLEASTDASFEYIYGALVKELKAAGYSSSEAQPIKAHYNALKKERRSVIIARAREMVNL